MRRADKTRNAAKERIWEVIYSADEGVGNGSAIRALGHEILRRGWPRGLWPTIDPQVATEASLELERLYESMC